MHFFKGLSYNPLGTKEERGMPKRWCVEAANNNVVLTKYMSLHRLSEPHRSEFFYFDSNSIIE